MEHKEHLQFWLISNTATSEQKSPEAESIFETLGLPTDIKKWLVRGAGSVEKKQLVLLGQDQQDDSVCIKHKDDDEKMAMQDNDIPDSVRPILEIVSKENLHFWLSDEDINRKLETRLHLGDGKSLKRKFEDDEQVMYTPETKFNKI